MGAQVQGDFDGKIKGGVGTPSLFSEFQLDNATGIALVAPAAGAVIALVTTGWSASEAALVGATQNVTAGTHTIASGKRRKVKVEWAIDQTILTNSQSIRIEVFRTRNGVRASVGGADVQVQPASALEVKKLVGSVTLNLRPKDVVDLGVTLSAGNFTGKRGYFRLSEV